MTGTSNRNNGRRRNKKGKGGKEDKSNGNGNNGFNRFVGQNTEVKAITRSSNIPLPQQFVDLKKSLQSYTAKVSDFDDIPDTIKDNKQKYEGDFVPPISELENERKKYESTVESRIVDPSNNERYLVDTEGKVIMQEITIVTNKGLKASVERNFFKKCERGRDWYERYQQAIKKTMHLIEGQVDDDIWNE